MDLLRNIFKNDKVIWIIFLRLRLISIIEVSGAVSTLTYKGGDYWGPITQHSITLIASAIVVVLMYGIPYKWFQVFPVFLYPTPAMLLALVILMGVIAGDHVNGAARWISFMELQFQLSELAKMTVIITVSSIPPKKQDDEGASPKASGYVMILTGLVCMLIAPENLSITMLLFEVVVLIMFIGCATLKKLAMLLGRLALVRRLGMIFLLAIPKDADIPFLHRFDIWKSRVTNLTEKEEVSTAKFDIDKDAQITYAYIAIVTNDVIGRAPGNSIQRDFLSQTLSDFTFTITIEELGLVGGAFAVILYIWLLARTDRVAQKCERTFPAFPVMGIALMLVLQVILNMMVAVGLFPVTGRPLSLISKGRISTLINCVYIGMILSVSRYAAYLEGKKDNPTPLLTGEEGSETVAGKAQTAAESTAEVLSSDAKSEE